MTIDHNPPLNFNSLVETNKQFVKYYRQNNLMKLINNKELMKEKSARIYLLDCIQVFSNYFQKVVALRSVFCEDIKFCNLANDHLVEEFGHNLSLLKDRNSEPPVWDPVLESTSAWFAWKMFTLNDEEKTLLIHFVLEASANIFFSAADKVMQHYQETNYFKIHSDADEAHEQMGVNILEHVDPSRLERLFLIQKQGWDVLNVTCNRIAELTLNNAMELNISR